MISHQMTYKRTQLTLLDRHNIPLEIKSCNLTNGKEQACVTGQTLMNVPNIRRSRGSSLYSDWLRAGQRRDWSLSPGKIKNFLFSK
jgi:hypothetical protein